MALKTVAERFRRPQVALRGKVQHAGHGGKLELAVEVRVRLRRAEGFVAQLGAELPRVHAEQDEVVMAPIEEIRDGEHLLWRRKVDEAFALEGGRCVDAFYPRLVPGALGRDVDDGVAHAAFGSKQNTP